MVNKIRTSAVPSSVLVMALAVVTVSTSCQHADNSAQTQNTSEAEQNASEADTEEQSGDEPGGFKVSKERQERITDQLKELTKDHPDRPDGLKGLDELMNRPEWRKTRPILPREPNLAIKGDALR